MSRHDGPSYSFRARKVLAGCLLMLGFAAVMFRLFHLQVIEAADLASKAQRQHQRTVTLEGNRGPIYDRNGKVLAWNLDVPSVFGVPTAIDRPRAVARELVRVLGGRVETLEAKLRRDKHFVWIARKLDPEQGRRLARLSLDGIGTVMEGRRFYPKGTLLAHVLGFAGMDGNGLEGVEHRYDDYLRGEVRQVDLQRDALGRTVFPKELTARAPSGGHAVVLTIDEVIQFVAEKELERAVLVSRAKGGIIIVMEPTTGAILAMGVYPTFDPNAFGSVEPQRWRNRALTDAYEPGSTLKILVAAAALEEKVKEPGTLLFGEHGEMEVANTVIHDHERSGWMTFAEAIQRSSNIGVVKTATALGDDRLYRYLRAFGFGERTEIDLPAETPGLVKEPGEWGRRTLASIAIGQEIGVTPLQLVNAMSAVANGGWLMRPYLVKEVRDVNGEVLVETKPEVRRRPVSAVTAYSLTEILEGVVTRGTGGRAAVPGYRVAGKTGTAQKFDHATGSYSSTKFVASFAGYVPAQDPQLAMVVVVDEPQGEAWGGAVAAPVFRRVAERVLPYLGVPPQEPVALTRASLATMVSAR
ncbi:MAG: peptidoglycan D,D-transpeptidase FtsI family protein [Nitrospirales bacterium]